jgi:hypothetical protein
LRQWEIEDNKNPSARERRAKTGRGRGYERGDKIPPLLKVPILLGKINRVNHVFYWRKHWIFRLPKVLSAGSKFRLD